MDLFYIHTKTYISMTSLFFLNHIMEFLNNSVVDFFKSHIRNFDVQFNLRFKLSISVSVVKLDEKVSNNFKQL